MQEREHLIIDGREWYAYEQLLGIAPEFVAGQRVLNVGCGGSNLANNLGRRGVTSSVVELDFQFDPVAVQTFYPGIPVGMVDSFVRYIRPQGNLRRNAVDIKRRLSQTEGRRFVQADAASLPFPNDSFDTVLSLWATYQIPEQKRLEVYEEMMRVGDALFLSPIFTPDFFQLTTLAQEHHFDIVVCQPFPSTVQEGCQFRIATPQSLNELLSFDPSERIIPPVSERPYRQDGYMNSRCYDGRGGSTIVLSRK